MFRETGKLQEQAQADALRIGISLGLTIKEARKERLLSLRQLAELSGVSTTRIGDVESGRPASLEVYARLARALRLRADFDLTDPRRRSMRLDDPVHAAMGEALAGTLRRAGFAVGLDEPFQHYQFAGRADVAAWSPEPRACCTSRTGSASRTCKKHSAASTQRRRISPPSSGGEWASAAGRARPM